jgi:hypothetical protein
MGPRAEVVRGETVRPEPGPRITITQTRQAAALAVAQGAEAAGGTPLKRPAMRSLPSGHAQEAASRWPVWR